MEKKLFRLYRYYDSNDVLLYIGISANFAVRNSAHSNSSFWFAECAKVTFEKYENQTELVAAEKLAIENEKPLHNIAHSTTAKRAPIKRCKRQPYEPSKKHVYVAECLKKYGHSDKLAEKIGVTRKTFSNIEKLTIKTASYILNPLYTYFKRRDK